VVVLPLKADGTYAVQHLFEYSVLEETPTGRRRGEIVWTGARPTFYAEPFVKGLGPMVKETSRLFRRETDDAAAG